jgi:hypothetical protein
MRLEIYVGEIWNHIQYEMKLDNQIIDSGVSDKSITFYNLLVNCWKKCVNVFSVCSWRIKNISYHTFRNIYLFCNYFSVKYIICHWRLSVKLY